MEVSIYFSLQPDDVLMSELHYSLTVKLMPSCCCADCVVVGAIVLRKMRARSQGEFGRY